MDIKSGTTYPSSALTNFAPHIFVIDGITCNSMEGFLQALKYKNPDMQIEVCKLVGMTAKRKGANKNWKRNQTLYWQGVSYKRDSAEYQTLLTRAYDALFENAGFKKALAATKNATLTHNIGKIKKADTVITRQEFCSQLLRLRNKF